MAFRCLNLIIQSIGFLKIRYLQSGVFKIIILDEIAPTTVYENDIPQQYWRVHDMCVINGQYHHNNNIDLTRLMLEKDDLTLILEVWESYGPRGHELSCDFHPLVDPDLVYPLSRV